MSRPLNILLWRTWVPLYQFPATFSCLDGESIGGTCSQLLWHAKCLTELGHHVQVLGISKFDITEANVDFIGASSRAEQEAALASGRVIAPAIIILEGAFSAASLFRACYPDAKILHIGQNIDRLGARRALNAAPCIDAYGFVSPGHLAEYCVVFPKLRHKFHLIRNAIPWESIHSTVPKKPTKRVVAWVGAWSKRGLRDWAETMEVVLRERDSYTWRLYGPSHGAHVEPQLPREIFAGLTLPYDRVIASSLPIRQLAHEIAEAQVVLVSLADETACISALDAHAVGRPVVSGNDMVFKFINPEGTGLRVYRGPERLRALLYLLDNRDLCDRLGARGQAYAMEHFTEHQQRQDLENVIDYLSLLPLLKEFANFEAPGQRRIAFDGTLGRIARKWRKFRHRLQGHK